MWGESKIIDETNKKRRRGFKFLDNRRRSSVTGKDEKAGREGKEKRKSGRRFPNRENKAGAKGDGLEFGGVPNDGKRKTWTPRRRGGISLMEEGGKGGGGGYCIRRHVWEFDLVDGKR